MKVQAGTSTEQVAMQIGVGAFVTVPFSRGLIQPEEWVNSNGIEEISH